MLRKYLSGSNLNEPLQPTIHKRLLFIKCFFKLFQKTSLAIGGTKTDIFPFFRISANSGLDPMMSFVNNQGFTYF